MSIMATTEESPLELEPFKHKNMKVILLLIATAGLVVFLIRKNRKKPTPYNPYGKGVNKRIGDL